jgi:hypothetical protein
MDDYIWTKKDEENTMHIEPLSSVFTWAEHKKSWAGSEQLVHQAATKTGISRLRYGATVLI